MTIQLHSRAPSTDSSIRAETRSSSRPLHTLESAYHFWRVPQILACLPRVVLGSVVLPSDQPHILTAGFVVTFTHDFLHFVLFCGRLGVPGFVQAEPRGVPFVRRFLIWLQVVKIEDGEPGISVVQAKSVRLGINLLQDFKGAYPALN
jgi:hypothetical protein